MVYWGYNGLVSHQYTREEAVRVYTRLYERDSEFFREQTEASCYWSGFLWGDAAIIPSRHRFRLELATIDYGHLLKLKNVLQYGGPIKLGHNGQSARLEVSDKELLRGLTALGAIEAVKPEYLRHYIRGLVDANGSIYQAHGKNHVWWNVSFVGTHALMAKIQAHLVTIVGLAGSAIYAVGPNRLVSTFYYGGNRQVPRILAYLYQGASVALDRKRITVQRCLNGVT